MSEVSLGLVLIKRTANDDRFGEPAAREERGKIVRRQERIKGKSNTETPRNPRFNFDFRWGFTELSESWISQIRNTLVILENMNVQEYFKFMS